MEPLAQQQTAQIQWRCRRGMLELDLILQKFLEFQYHTLSEQQKIELLELLETPDPTLLAWLMNQEPAPESYKALILQIRGLTT